MRYAQDNLTKQACKYFYALGNIEEIVKRTEIQSE